MKDYKSCKTTNEYIHEAMMKRLTKIIFNTFIIIEVVICIISACSLPKPVSVEDYMISPDMQSYIERYHAIIDEYGVE